METAEFKNIYIYLIYSVRNHENNSIRGDSHDHLKKNTKIDLKRYRTAAACGRGLVLAFLSFRCTWKQNRNQSYLSNIIFVVQENKYCRRYLLARVQLFYLSTSTYLKIYFPFSILPTEYCPAILVIFFYTHFFSSIFHFNHRLLLDYPLHPREFKNTDPFYIFPQYNLKATGLQGILDTLAKVLLGNFWRWSWTMDQE